MTRLACVCPHHRAVLEMGSFGGTTLSTSLAAGKTIAERAWLGAATGGQG